MLLTKSRLYGASTGYVQCFLHYSLNHVDTISLCIVSNLYKKRLAEIPQEEQAFLCVASQMLVLIEPKK